MKCLSARLCVWWLLSSTAQAIAGTRCGRIGQSNSHQETCAMECASQNNGFGMYCETTKKQRLQWPTLFEAVNTVLLPKTA
eukprot:6425713-Amphidinium_carterae.1